MLDIKEIQKLFPKPKGEENKIVDIIEKILKTLDEMKRGSILSKREDLDYKTLYYEAKFPEKISSEDEVIDFITSLYSGVGNYSHPFSQLNVVPPPTTLSIAVDSVASRYNENSIYDHYGPSATRSEIITNGMLADLIGYPKESSGGIFTFGGTGCNLYAAKVAIEKINPNIKKTGINEKIHMFCSELAHFSVKNAAMWTGIGMDNVKIIPSNTNNKMCTNKLREELDKSIAKGAKIGIIYATMGTTDAFGIDPIKEIYEVKREYEEKLGYKIHLHADSVIGWSYLSFKENYEIIDKLPKIIRSEIREILKNIKDLHLADSIGIDFHKTGWTPYICSTFLVKNIKDLLNLSRDREIMPYLFHGNGYQPGIFTLESSRPNYAQKALANLMLFGREGFQKLIIHMLEISTYLRNNLETFSNIAIVNQMNPAFVTDFRVYPKSLKIKSGFEFYEKELKGEISKEIIEEVNKFNIVIIEEFTKFFEENGGPAISRTDAFRKSENGTPILSLKSYPMSPFIEKKHMDILVNDIELILKKLEDSSN